MQKNQNSVNNSSRLAVKVGSFLSLSVALALTATANAQEKPPVPISSFISAGSSSTSGGEAAPNLWFFVNNNQSMEYIYAEDSTNTSMAFLPEFDYQLPYDLDGNRFPEPPKNPKAAYETPFYKYLESGMDYLTTGKTTTLEYDLNKCYGSPAEGLTDEQKRGCRIWQTYYNTRGNATKSILSIILTDEKKRFQNTRVGYISAFPGANLKKTAGGREDNALPVVPLAKENNYQDFMKWLFGLGRQSGDQRFMSRVGETVNEIAKAAKKKDRKNPFIMDAGKAYDAINNPILACRRNHLLIFTDGEWGDEGFGGAPYVNSKKERKLGAYDFPANTTDKKHTLPDGKVYSPISPYKRKISSDNNTTQRTFADITFTAWAKDLDGDDTNNTYTGSKGNNAVPPFYPKVDGVVQEHKGDKYWHPYNDPATWQHINTHFIGFDLSVDEESKDEIARINPPIKNANGEYITVANGKENQKGIRKKYLQDKWKWELNVGAEIDPDEIHRDMASAALAGRGRFYNATNAKELKEAIISILDLVQETGVSFGVTGAAGTLASIQSDGGSFYSTRYHAGTFTGELLRRNLFNGKEDDKEKCFKQETLDKMKPQTPIYGRICDNSVEWNAAKKLTKDFGEDQSKRKVYTIKRDDNGNLAEGVDFKYERLSVKQRNRLMGKKNSKDKAKFPVTFGHFDSTVNDDDKLKALIDYLKGSKEHETVEKTNKADKDETVEKTNKADKDVTVKKFRSRNSTFEDGEAGRNILGAIMRSSPIVSGIPRVSQMHTKKQSKKYMDFVKSYIFIKNDDGTDDNVSSCKKDKGKFCIIPKVNRNDVDIVYVGANDGMLHAFRASDGEEVFAYVPDAVYENLSQLTEDGNQVSFVDGNINIVVVDDEKGNINQPWKKILVGSMGGGAKGIYALNVTNPAAKTAKDIVMWEYTDKDSNNVGNIIAKPAIVQLNDGTWAVVFGNGYNAESNKAALIVVNALTGKKIQEIVLDNNKPTKKKEEEYKKKKITIEHTDYVNNSQTNGLAPPYFQIYANKDTATQNPNWVDRVYAGDLQGNMWIFDFTKATINGGITVAKKSNETKAKPLFVAKNEAGVKQPITVAPLVRLHPTKYGNIVHFGTGALFEENDLSSTIQNSIYAIWDDWNEPSNEMDKDNLPGPRTGNIVKRAHLQKVLFNKINGKEKIDGEEVTTVGGTKATARTLEKGQKAIEWATDPKQADFSKKKRGWYVDLPKGERAWQSPYYTFGANNSIGIGYDTANYKPVAAGSSNNTPVEECGKTETNAISWKMAFNANDGTRSLPGFGTLDTDGDGDVTGDDVINKGGDEGNTPPTGLQKTGITLSGSSMSTFSPLKKTTGGGSRYDLCNYITEVGEDIKGGYYSKQICRKSHTGSWTELK